MKQKTPLAILEEWVKENYHFHAALLDKIQELKEVEKEQMIGMWNNSYWGGIAFDNATNYFNENYEQ